MKNNKKRKGFTIVELVIVIAVIGILAAILIPTFVNLTARANRVSNESFVKNINTQLAMDDAQNKKHETPESALAAAKKIGFHVDVITPYEGNDIVWDEVHDRFAIVKGDFAQNRDADHVVFADSTFDPATPLHKLWKFYDTMPAPAEQTYSIVAKEGWNTKDVQNLKVGLDVANATGVETISYVGGDSAQSVIIRTNGGTLTIDAEDDTVHHYGEGQVLDIKAIAGSSYHEHGHFPKGEIKKGRIVVEDNAQVEIVNVTGAGVILDKVGTGSIELCYASSDENVPTGSAGVETTVAEIELDDIVARTENGAYETLSAALENLGTSKTLYIVADFDETFTSSVSGEKMYNIQNPVTIDGQGHTVNATFVINNEAVKEFIEFNAPSTVKNLNINGTGVKYIIVAQAEATFENVNITADNACISAADTTGHAVARNCTFRFVKGEHTRNDHQEAWAPVSSQYGATLELFDCVLTSSDGYGMLIWPSGGTLEATRCSITSAKGYAVSWIRNGSTSTPTDSIVRVNNCAIEGSTTCEAKYNSANPSGKEAYVYKDGVLVATTVSA